MKAPHLNRALVLEDAYRVPDGSGGFVINWQVLGTLWADITAGTGRDKAEDEVSKSRVPLKIVVRAAAVGSPARPMAGQRFRDGSRTYKITAVADRDASLRYLLCHAEEEVAA